MLPIAVNGQLGAAAYHRGADSEHHAYAIVVVETTSTTLRRITLFVGEASFHHFALPLIVPPR
jgi:RNA polymerase sigma-70 factor (ECF subfamily)